MVIGSTTTLWRLSGASAMLGGGLYALFDVLSLWDEGPVPPEEVSRFVILALSSAFALWGLVGVYGIQVREAGLLGLVGFAAGFAGALVSFGVGWAGMVVVPEVLDSAYVREGPERALGIWLLEIRLPLTAIGFLLLGIATLRARVLSRAGAWIMIAGAFLGALNTLGILALPGARARAGAGRHWLHLAGLVGPARRRAAAVGATVSLGKDRYQDDRRLA